MPFSSRQSAPRRLLPGAVLVCAGLGVFTLLEARRAAEALEAPPGPAIEPMRFKSGITVLVASQPALPSFTATVHYKVGQAQEWQGLFGAAELVGQLMLDGTAAIGTRDPRLETSLLAELDQLDQPLHRKRQALEVIDPARAAGLRTEVETLKTRQHLLLEQLKANSIFRIYSRLYQERGATAPRIDVSSTEVQYTVTLPSDQLSYFLALEGARLAGFSSRNFYAARATLAEERRREAVLPGLQLLRGLAAQAFQVHPFGRYQADPASIEGIDRGELELFKRVHFRPSQTVIALAGGIRGADVRAIADRYLSDLAPGPNPGLIEPVEPLQRGERRLEVFGSGPSEVLLAFHRETADLRAGDPLLPVLLELLGDPHDGLLAGLRTKKTAGQIVAVEYPASPPLGALYPSLILVGATAAGSTTALKLEQSILEVLNELATSGPTPEALEGARRRVQAKLAQAMGEPSKLAPLLARAYATLDDEAALSRLYQKVNDVRIDQVKLAAQRLFVASNRTVGVIRPEPPVAVASGGHEGSSTEAHDAAHGGKGDAHPKDGAAHDGEGKAAQGAGHAGEKAPAEGVGHADEKAPVEGQDEKAADGEKHGGDAASKDTHGADAAPKDAHGESTGAGAASSEKGHGDEAGPAAGEGH